MLSRAACVPRICWTCRIGLTQGRAQLSARPLPVRGERTRRTIALKPIIQSKERIEGLISGTLKESDPKATPRAQKRPRHRQKGKGRSARRENDDPEDDLDQFFAAWAVSSKDGKLPNQPESPSPSSFVDVSETPTELDTKPQLDPEVQLDPESAPEPVVEDTFAPEPTFDTDSAVAVAETEPSIEPESIEATGELSDKPRVSDSTIPELPMMETRRIFRHDLLRAHNLGVDALGKPVDALIIKNPNKMRMARKSAPLIEEEPAAPAVSFGLQDLVLEDDGSELTGSPAEAWANIEEMRPTDTTTLRRRDFDALVDALVAGFTRDQLAGYFNQGQWESTRPTAETSPYSWVIKQGLWNAAKPNNWGNLKPKQYQATMIMLAKWHIEVQEQVEGLGRTPIWLRPEVFQLIARPPNSVLQSLKAEFLDESNNEKITASTEESRLNIYSRRAIAPVILSRLDEIMQSLTSRTISVQHVESDNLLPPVLEELGRITNTAITHDGQTRELNVTWLADENLLANTESPGAHVLAEAVGTEDPADIVLRLLTKPSQTQSGGAHVVASTKTAKTKNSSFVQYHREKRSMSWRDKSRQWSRYVSPVIKASTEGQSLVDLTKSVSLASPTESERAEPVALTTATFGHILHTKAEIQPGQLAKNRRILSPVVPHPASLTPLTSGTEASVIQQTAILLNFTPSQVESQGVDVAPPSIQLRLPVNPDDDLANFSIPSNSTLHGVLSTHIDDILLPNESVDLQLKQLELVPLDIQQQPLKDFMIASQFNLLEGRLKTPAKAQFSLPTRYLSPKLSNSGDEEALVCYMFMGLQIHQTVDTEWQGHTLRYNSIEGGHHAGQRQELSLLAGPPGDNSRFLSAEQRGTFLKLAGEIASGQHFSWHDGHELMQQRSDEEFTLEFADEDLEGEALEARESDTLLEVNENGLEVRPLEIEEEHESSPSSSSASENATPQSEEDVTSPPERSQPKEDAHRADATEEEHSTQK